MGTKIYRKYGDFGDRLKELRKKKYRTQDDFAEDMDVTVETVRNWEQGRVLPEMGTLIKISRLLDCDLDYLTGRIKCQTHDLQFIHDQTGLSEGAIRKLQSFMTIPDYEKIGADLREGGVPEEKISDLIEREREKYDTSIQRDYPDILSLLIEDMNAEYLISLITRRVKGYQPRPSGRQLTHEDLTQDDLWIDLEGQKVLTHKRNLLDSLIQSEVASLIPVVTETYHSIKSEL